MNAKTLLLISIPEKSDPFQNLTRLKNQGKIIHACVKGRDGLFVSFDNRQVSTDHLLNITGGSIINEQRYPIQEQDIRLLTSRAKRYKNYNPLLNVGL